MKIENGFLINGIEKRYIKDTLIYIKNISNNSLFKGKEELYEIEIKILRFFILIIFYNYNNFGKNKNEIILDILESYKKNYTKLLFLVTNYKFGYDMFMLIDYGYRYKNIFYDFLYDIYIYHIKNFNLKNNVTGFFLIKNNLLELHIYRQTNFGHDSSNSLFFEILDNGNKIFGFALFFGRQEIFIGNLQYTKFYYNKYGGLKKLRLHKYAFYFLKEISIKFGKSKILAFSNENHCNGHSIYFSPIYNDLFNAIGMNKNENHFYYGDISNLDIRDRDNNQFKAIVNEALNSIYI